MLVVAYGRDQREQSAYDAVLNEGHENVVELLESHRSMG